MDFKKEFPKKNTVGQNGYGMYAYQDFDTYRKAHNAFIRLSKTFFETPPKKFMIKKYLCYFRIHCYF